jgi:hypothetical protein
MEKGEKKKKNQTLGFMAAAGIGVGLGVLGKMLFDNFSEPVESESDKITRMIKEKREDSKMRSKITDDEVEIESFICPICNEIMIDPVITPQGISYERREILEWLKKSNTCPITKEILSPKDLITNYALKSSIDDYKKCQLLRQNSINKGESKQNY